MHNNIPFSNFLKKPSGFTLIEILVVLAIIGVLSTLTMAGVRIAREKAKVAKALHDIDAISSAIAMLANDSSQWPGHQAAFTISAAANNEYCGPDANSADCAGRTLGTPAAGLTANDTVTPYPNWQGPYMKEIPVDAWGHEYFFDTDYNVDASGLPEGCASGGPYQSVAAIGSYGPDGLGVPNGASPPAYGCDDIIKIIYK